MLKGEPDSHAARGERKSYGQIEYWKTAWSQSLSFRVSSFLLMN